MTKKTRFFNSLQLYIQILLFALAIQVLIANNFLIFKIGIEIGWIIIAMAVNILIYNLRKKESK